MKLLEEVKKNSSKWMKTKGYKYQNFYWQDGYAAFSVDLTRMDGLVRYIENQFQHHQEISFQNECRGIYKKYQMPYDERYVWD
ncbi:transposase [Spirosoma telluris]